RPGRPVARPAAVSFSRDGSRLAVGSQGGDHRLHVFDTLTGAALWTAELGEEFPGGTAFAADGGTVAVATLEGRVRLFDAAGNPGAVLESKRVAGLTALAFSPDGARVLASASGAVVAWDRATGRLLWKRE